MDFTLKTYKLLLHALRNKGFSFLTFKESLSCKQTKSIVLRQDVDLFPGNSLVFAWIQAELGIRSTFYFRAVPESFNEDIIKEIQSLGHEVGYHYEDLSFAWAKLKASGVRHQAAGEKLERILVDIAIESFAKNLERIRRLVPVKTICMHGCPMSRWDSRLLWKYYDYHDLGIIGEPYFDVDFNSVLYLTDTGRRWDGDSFNVRDKAVGRRLEAVGETITKKHNNQHETIHFQQCDLQPSAHRLQPSPGFHSTSDIICAAEASRLPDQIMMTFHPQRWTDKPLPWAKELVWQNVKNVGKYFIVKRQAVRRRH